MINFVLKTLHIISYYVFPIFFSYYVLVALAFVFFTRVFVKFLELV